MPASKLTRRALLATGGAAPLLLAATADAAVAKPVAPLPPVAMAPLKIGTAGLLGVYYPIGSAICRLLRGSPVIPTDAAPTCTELATPGSVYNLRALHRPGMDLAVVQSDALYQAVNGLEAFADHGPDTSYRTVLSIVIEPFTVVTRTLFGTANFRDFTGRRVSVGRPGSGQQATMQNVMAALGWNTGDVDLVTDFDSDQQGFALCDRKVDAMVFVGAAPSPSVADALTRCRSSLLGLDADLIEAIVRDRPYYRPTVIPANTYPGAGTPTATFGTEAVLVAPASAPDEMVYRVTRAVAGDVAEFRRLHLAFREVTERSLVPDLDFVPIHPGAARYFREAKLV
jgi:TRAP transporter TAXI family solute receptor